jgi:mRNA interferase MazF
VKSYAPKKGDFIDVTFDPQSGHEQRGRRPALVVSNTLFNEQTGLAIVCPVTTTDRGYPFHVAITDGPQVAGFVMVEQVKSIDFQARKAKQIGKASDGVLDTVLSILDACIY